jgi:hypothetical protein
VTVLCDHGRESSLMKLYISSVLFLMVTIPAIVFGFGIRLELWHIFATPIVIVAFLGLLTTVDKVIFLNYKRKVTISHTKTTDKDVQQIMEKLVA